MPRIKKEIFFSIVLLIILLVVSFFSVEYISRIYFPKQGIINANQIFDLHSTRGYSFVKDKELRYARLEYDNVVYFNKKGLRDREYDYEKKNKRIVMIGDSFTAALEVPLEKTTAKQLESLLNGSYEVINGGVSAYDTLRSVDFLENELIKYNPDIVILNFYIGNDFIDNSDNNLFVIENSHLVRKPIKISFSWKLRNYLSKHLSSYTAVAHLLSKMKSGNMEKIYPELEMLKYNSSVKIDYNKTRYTLRWLSYLSKKNDFDVLVVVIPTKFQVDEGIYKDLSLKYGVDDLDLLMLDNILVEYLEEYDLKYLYLLPEFKKRNINNSYYWNIDGHWNEEGNRLAAELIYERLINNNLP